VFAAFTLVLALAFARTIRAAADDIVLYASDVTTIQGNWSTQSASGAAGNQQMASADSGWSSADAPQANPSNFFETSFSAQAGTTYHVWLRLRASGNSKWNDSVWVQFDDSTTTDGSAAYRIGTTSGLLENLEPCKDCGVNGWGWIDRGYWVSQSGLIQFSSSGTHTVRVQTREDGVQVDQIVLSPSTFLSAAPGQASGDSTIISKPSSAAAAAPPSGSGPYLGSPVSLPGVVQAENFDNGADGVSSHDTTPGNSGGVYRTATNIDIEPSAGGGFDIGWIAAGEWMNYSVNVASAGTYTVQFRTASPSGGGSLQVGFNGPSSVWKPVPIPTTGGWQNWTTVSTTVTLGAGTQLMTLLVNSPGFNLDSITVTAGQSSAPPPPPPPSTPVSQLRVMTWNIHSGTDESNNYTLPQQVSFMASQNPDVIFLQEVSVWNEDQPTKFQTLIQQATGRTWYASWAPSVATGGCLGNLILTRIPIANKEMKFSPPSAFARAQINVNGVPIQLFTSHIDYYNTSTRTVELNDLMSWARSFGGPRLAGGDYNSWWGEWWITQMETEYSDTWRDVTGSNENGYTIGNVRFDYIFRAFDGGSHLTPTNAYVGSTALSDHRPFIADYRVQ